MNLQQIADAAASYLKENLLTLPDLAPIPVTGLLPWDSPLRPTYERVWVSFKPGCDCDGGGEDQHIEANYVFPCACSMARMIEREFKGTLQFACPDDGETDGAAAGIKDGVVVVVTEKYGTITLSTLVGVVQ